MAVVKWPGLQQYDAEMKQYISTHYEPKLQFDPVPVYNVTLAEDITATAQSPYVIDFNDEYDEITSIIIIPSTNQANNIQFAGIYGDDDIIVRSAAGLTVNSQRIVNTDWKNWGGLAMVINSQASYGNVSGYSMYAPSDTPILTFIGNAKIHALQIWSNVLLAGTIITIYAAKEV